MANYNFQIKEEYKDWDALPVRSLEFHERHDATAFAWRLSRLFQAEVRMTQGEPEYNARMSGTYIHAGHQAQV